MSGFIFLCVAACSLALLLFVKGKIKRYGLLSIGAALVLLFSGLVLNFSNPMAGLAAGKEMSCLVQDAGDNDMDAVPICDPADHNKDHAQTINKVNFVSGSGIDSIQQLIKQVYRLKSLCKMPQL